MERKKTFFRNNTIVKRILCFVFAFTLVVSMGAFSNLGGMEVKADENNTLTVHFQNALNWETVAAYFGDSDWKAIPGYEDYLSGSGKAINADAEHEGWYTYSVTLSSDIEKVCGLFDCGSWTAQTGDYSIDISGDTEVWMIAQLKADASVLPVAYAAPASWDGTGEDGDGDEKDSDEDDVDDVGTNSLVFHFKNEAEWENVYIALYDPSWGTIQGYKNLQLMSADGEHEGWYTFTAEVPGSLEGAWCIFTDSSKWTNQTGNYEVIVSRNTEVWMTYQPKGTDGLANYEAPAEWRTESEPDYTGMTELEKLIAQAENLNPLLYTGATWAAMSGCLEDAKDALSGDDTAQSNACDLLQYAIDNLDTKSDGMALGSDISWCAQRDRQYNNEDGVSKPMYQLITEDYGYNAVRLRTWTGNPDGSVGKNTIIAYAKKCQDAGLRIMIDFHYADNWADPGKQPAPAEWNVSGTSSKEADRVAQLLYEYTKDVMEGLVAEDIYPEWVQVGNEIDGGMVWDLGRTTNMRNLVKLLQAGTDAVREVSPTTKVVIHRSSGAETDNVMKFYQDLIKYGYSDFDVIGLSFYPYDMDPTSLIESLGNTFDSLYEKFCANTNREIMVVEIGSNYMEYEGGASYVEGYNMIVNVINLLKEVPDGRGTGCLFWEIQNYEYINDRPNIVWRAFSPNAQLIRDTLITGLTLSADTLEVQCNGVEVLNVMYEPERPDITALRWTSSDPEIATVDSKGLVTGVSVGETTITVESTDGSNVTATCRVTVIPETAGLKNGGFELGDQYWEVDIVAGSENTKISNSDNHLAGSYSLHYAASSDGLDFSFHQDIAGLEPGLYTLSCRVMGDRRLSTGYLYANSSAGEIKSEEWQTRDWTSDESGWISVTLENIEVGVDGNLTVGASVKSDSSNAWGDFDEFTLVKVEADDPEEGSVETGVEKGEGAPDAVIEISDDLKDSIFTPAEKESVENGEDARIYMSIDKLSDADVDPAEKALVEDCVSKSAEGYMIGAYLDLNLYKQIGEGQPVKIEELDGDVIVTVTIPENIEGSSFKIVRIHGGAATLIEGTYKEASREFTFRTNAFSTYALLYSAGKPDDEEPGETDDKKPDDGTDTVTTITGNVSYDGWAGVSAEQKAKLMQESLAQNAAVIAPKTNDNAPLTMVIMLLMAGAVAVAGAVGKKRKSC